MWSTCPPTIPSTSGDRPPTAIIPGGITWTSALVLGTDSALAFTLETFSAVSDGVVGAGDRTGSIPRSFEIVSFSLITVTAGEDLEVARRGRTIPAIGGGSPIRIVRSATATAEFRRPGPTQGKPEVGAVSARRGPLPARVRNAATAPPQPLVEAAHTARVRRTAAATAQTAAHPAIALARPLAAAVDSAEARPPEEVALCPAIAPAPPMAAAVDSAEARHTEEAAEPAPALLIAAVARAVPAAAPTVVVVAVPAVAVAAVPAVAAVAANQPSQACCLGGSVLI